MLWALQVVGDSSLSAAITVETFITEDLNERTLDIC